MARILWRQPLTVRPYADLTPSREATLTVDFPTRVRCLMSSLWYEARVR